MMKRNSIIIVILFVSFSNILSQNQKGEFRRDLSIGNYTFLFVNSEVEFFTGSLTVTDRKLNKEVFRADSFYTQYNRDTLIDIDNNGSNELLVDLGMGLSIYDYNMFLIFDFKNVNKPFSIHNAELVKKADENPLIVSNVRLSPGYLGTGYSFPLKYYQGKILVETDPDESIVLSYLDINEADIIEFIKEYENETDACSDESQLQVFYESFITQKKILKKENSGWKFFDRHYICKNKKRVKSELKKKVTENFNYINNPLNYFFNSKTK